jgi:SAM-dependent methyltransferase
MQSTPTTETRDRIDYVRRRGELPFGMTNRDLAVNYFKWQVQLFKGYTRGTIIDHGAGTGGLTNALLAAHAGTEVIAVEPDPQLVEVLHERFDRTPEASVCNGTLDDYLAIHGPACVDTIVSSNVIEHIEDDVACLQEMFELLRPGGAVGLYIPARPELFGSLDRAVGHYRRYTRPELTTKLTRCGFQMKSVAYRNVVGVLPWIVSGQILKLQSVGDASIKFFDRVVFPVCQRIETAFPPKYGLNLVAIAVKPSA